MVTRTFFTVLILCIFLSASFANASDLKIIAEEYPPYSYRIDGVERGIFVDLVQLIQEKLGDTPSEIKFYPWARGYRMLQAGEVDILLPMSMTAERSTMFKFVGPVFWDDIYFYRKKGSKVNVFNFGDAKEVGKIAVTRDDISHHVLASMGYHNLDYSSGLEFDFMKLLHGRADLVPMGRRVISYFFKRTHALDFKEIERVGPPVYFLSSYIAFSRQISDTVIKKWQAAFDELRENGEFQKILDKYFPPDRVD